MLKETYKASNAPLVIGQIKHSIDIKDNGIVYLKVKGGVMNNVLETAAFESKK